MTISGARHDRGVVVAGSSPALKSNWDGSWSTTDTNVHPPAPDSAGLVDYLLEIGVFRERSERRIDAPDLFLAGLGMSRKGGVRKR